MKKLLILGGGTGGTIMANKLHRVLDRAQWKITVVERSERHYYQPGFLFIPFGIYSERDVIKPSGKFFPLSVDVITAEIERIEPQTNRVILRNGAVLDYDFLIIATGTNIHPEETEGMAGDLWQKSIFDFYTIEGTMALTNALKEWKGGRIIMHITEMPIKCPVAPLEFLFLADAFFTEKGIRNKVELQLVTPLSGAFTKPIASRILGESLSRRNITVVPEFNIARVDTNAKTVVSWDDITIPFDLLVTVPTNKGDAAIGRSGMGDELDFVPTDKNTLRSRDYENIFVIGDATDLPSSKAGSVAHFQSDILFENLLSAIKGHPLQATFDGHSNCFIESGSGKGVLIDFNYTTEPLPGTFPYAGIGPFPLLKESRISHYGKLMFRWVYWNMLLKGRGIPTIHSHMTMSGKRFISSETIGNYSGT